MPTRDFYANVSSSTQAARSFFEELAQVTGDDRPLCVLDAFLHDITDALATDNPHFSRVKFLRACGMRNAADFEEHQS